MESPYRITLDGHEKQLICRIQHTLLKDAVSLEPCLHKVSEVAAVKMFAGTIGKICPTCQGIVTEYEVDQQMRNLAENFESLQKFAIQKAPPPKEEKIEKMEGEFRGRRLSFAGVILDLGDFKDLTDADLAWFAERAPHVKELIVRSNKITRIPFQHLKKLECYTCPSLELISADEAEEITCVNCKALSALFAPKAKKVHIRSCESLPALTLENAEDVHITHCHKLARLSLPLATRVNCSDNSDLQELSLPQAKWITCSNLFATKKHEFPEALAVNCSLCSFEELTLPKVKVYDNFYSSKMKLNIPFDAKIENMHV